MTKPIDLDEAERMYRATQVGGWADRISATSAFRTYLLDNWRAMVDRIRSLESQLKEASEYAVEMEREKENRKR